MSEVDHSTAERGTEHAEPLDGVDIDGADTGRGELLRQVAGVQTHGVRGWFEREKQALRARQARRRRETDSRLMRAGQALGDNLVNVVLVIVIASVIGYVGISVMSTTNETVDVEANSAFDNASTSLTTGTETAFSLVEVVYIVLLLGIIVGALVFLRGGRR